MEDPEEKDDGERRPWPSLIGLALIALLVVLGIFLAQKLRSNSQIQDCVMSGRTNCAPISTQ